MPPDVVTDEERRARAELAQQRPAQPIASIGDIWNAEIARTGLDTFVGQSQLMTAAHDKLVAAIEGAAGQRVGDIAREHNIRFDGTVDGRLAALRQIADTLPEDKRKELEPLLDVRGRAADEAQRIEREADDVGARTYGLSGHAVAFGAGIARQMVDPVVMAANVVTAPIGGPFKGPLLPVLFRQAAAGAAAQALMEPSIQRGREELGLDAGWSRGVHNVLEAGVGSAGFTGVLRLGAFAWRGARALFPAGDVAPAPASGVLQGDLLRMRVGSMLAPEDLEAAARFAERNTFSDMQRPAPMPADQFSGNLERTSNAMNEHRPVDRAAAAMGGWLDPESLAPDNTVGNRAQARSAQYDPNRFAPTDGEERQFVIRPAGGRLPVVEKVVELKDIIASHNLDGVPNPSYPADLQPRDRAAAASRAFVAEKAAALEPELLGRSPTAASGAPVIGADGVVESGNGRVMMIARAYDRHPERAQAYRDFLTGQGHDIEGMEHPVLVRVREGEMSTAERAAFAREANVAPVANLSVRERAFADVKSIDDNLLATYRGGRITSAENAPFVRAFADRVVAPEERPQFISGNEQLSAAGAQRVEAALVAKAWGSPEIVGALYETTDPNSRAILGAFADTAPLTSRLRGAIESNRVAPEVDPTPALVDAYKLVDRARSTGAKITDLVDQIDLERGAVPDATREAVRLYFRDDGLRIAAGRDVVAARIEQAINRALDTQNAIGDLFGAEFDRAGTLRAAQLAGQSLEDLPIDQVRLEGETESDFAKRVIDQRPAPKQLPEQHGVHFQMSAADRTVPTADLVLSKSAADQPQSVDNAAKRMAAHTTGELPPRAPVKVAALPDGKFLVVDGNATLAAVQRYGWESLPVETVPPLFEGKTGLVMRDRADQVMTGRRAALAEHQPFDTIDRAQELAPANQKRLVAALKELVGDETRVKDPGVKDNRARMEEKVADKYDGHVRYLSDIVRAGVVVGSPEEAQQIINKLAQKFRVIDENWLKNDAGYFDRKLDVVMPDGQIAEVQLAPQAIWDAKKAGHKMYETRRSAPDDAQAAMLELERTYWGDVYKSLNESWSALVSESGGSPKTSSVSEKPRLASASESSRPSQVTSAALTGRQPPEEALNALPSETTTASVSPQENQRVLGGSAKAPSNENIGIPGPDGKPLSPATVNAAEQAIAEVGDFELALPGPEGTTIKMPVRQALAEAREDAIAAAEFTACVGEAAE